MAEAVGFEPTRDLPLPVFETGAIIRALPRFLDGGIGGIRTHETR